MFIFFISPLNLLYLVLSSYSLGYIKWYNLLENVENIFNIYIASKENLKLYNPYSSLKRFYKFKEFLNGKAVEI